jgi:hypothetical protein
MHHMSERLIVEFLAGLILIVPIWQIFKRAGLSAPLSLLLFVPGVGIVIVTILLAFMRWPAVETGEG